MKRLHSSILLFLLMAFVGLSQLVPAETGADEKGRIRELMQRWDDALVSRDAEFIAGVLADDFTYISAAGQVQNRAAHLGLIKSPDLRIEASSSSDFVIRVYGEVAVAIAEGRIKGSYKSKEFGGHYRYTDVWVKRGDRWQVVNTQITDLP